MDGSHIPLVMTCFPSACEDPNGFDVGLSNTVDTNLRLNSLCAMYESPKVCEVGVNKRKWDVGETLSSRHEFSLALELGNSRSFLHNKKSNDVAAREAILDVGEAGEQSHTDCCLDFNLNLGSKRLCKDVKDNCVKVDLELSLSTGATDSDLTSITQPSSPTQNAVAAPTLSATHQTIDEGSTSSKWKPGPLLPVVDPLQTTSASLEIGGQANNEIVASVVSDIASVIIQSSTLDEPVTSKQQRRSSVKTCQFPGCQKGARGASGHCISHGGGRRCQRVGCQKGAEGKTAFCKAHGGGRRCEHLGCTKSAEGRTNLCIAHGGGRRCTFPGGCSRAARGKSGLCIRHGGGKRCKMENCTKSAEGISGLCIGHGGGRRCQFPECTKGAQGSTKFCKAHGGGKRCTFVGCTKGAEGSTLLCKAHGGGKRCSFEGGGVCSKSVHGGTLYCVSHGGGKRCGVSGCTKSARGRTNFCVRHGGGRRCQFESCGKSAQGSTDFCKAHGGGKRCLWGQPGSGFGADSLSPCDKFARGKIGLCAAHTAQVHDKRVHGNGTVGLKMKEIATENVPEFVNDVAEGTSTLWSGFSIGIQGHNWSPMQTALANCKLLVSKAGESSNSVSLPEGRVHGGSLMAMLREA